MESGVYTFTFEGKFLNSSSRLMRIFGQVLGEILINQRIYYNESNGSNTPQYNGNISATSAGTEKAIQRAVHITLFTTNCRNSNLQLIQVYGTRNMAHHTATISMIICSL